MIWLLPNLLIGIPLFLAWTLIPLWLVFKHPDTAPDRPASTGSAASGDSTRRIPDRTQPRDADTPVAA